MPAACHTFYLHSGQCRPPTGNKHARVFAPADPSVGKGLSAEKKVRRRRTGAGQTLVAWIPTRRKTSGEFGAVARYVQANTANALCWYVCQSRCWKAWLLW